jgi:hypothetical protein
MLNSIYLEVENISRLLPYWKSVSYYSSGLVKVPTFNILERIWRHSKIVEVWSFKIGEEEETVDKNEQGGYTVQDNSPAHLPVTIVIAPNMPLNSAGCLGRQNFTYSPIA